MQERHDLEKNRMSEDEIDENLEESFPASDPPSWNLGTNHREDKAHDEVSENEDRNMNSERAFLGKEFFIRFIHLIEPQ